jgi:hypothetical protein
MKWQISRAFVVVSTLIAAVMVAGADGKWC